MNRAVVVFCGVVGFLMPACYGLLNGVREPGVHDEFSYLLGASTFAQGRLSNPTPALPEFFEAPHVLVEPTYNSKYPPAQAVMLAIGYRIFGDPIWGVWLSCGLFAACLCWMLQSWTSTRWAIAITLLTSVTLGTSSYWAQSYWGGMVAATGGALLLGGLRQTIHHARIHVSVLMAVGIVILANSRPYEGLLICLPAGLLLARWMLRSSQVPLPAKLNLVVVPACIVFVAGGLCMGIYNRAVTGSFTKTPYDIHVRQYWQRGVFVFERVHQPERTPPDRVAMFYREHETPPESGAALTSTLTQNLSSRLFGLAGTPFGVAYLSPDPGYQGLLLWLALLVSVWRSLSIGATAAAVLFAVGLECLAWKFVPFYPRVLILSLVTCWAAAFYLSARRNPSARFIVGAIGLLALGQSLTLWWWPHYAAPALPLLLAVVAFTLQKMARRSPAFATRRVVAVTACLFIVHVSMLGLVASAHANRDDGAGSTRGLRRAEIKNRIEREAGKHVVFVRYASDYTVHDEWVYNLADLNASRVIFAHDLGSKNPELIALYPDRTAWLVTVTTDRIHLAPCRFERGAEQ